LVHVSWKRERKKIVETDTTAHSCRAKEEMRRLIAKHPDGLAGFHGDLAPTNIGTTDVDATASVPGLLEHMDGLPCNIGKDMAQ
jgi:hypothetical protein